ncbi:MAG: MFS transporter [Verrucomicrobiae bacterium]|nr:MFS transporter [Verrucomicrobiae bacterium]
MNPGASIEPSPEIVSRTFRVEMVRAVAAGWMETAMATFAILIAVRAFDSGPTAKAILLGSYAVGMIGSLFVVPLAANTGWRVNRLAGAIALVSSLGFCVAALFPKSEGLFVIGMCVGFVGMALPLPLQTQYLRENFPDARRGRLFSRTLLVRASSSMAFAALGGWLLDLHFDWFPWIIAAFAVAAMVSAICYWSVPRLPATDRGIPSRRVALFRAMRWIRLDRPFRLVLLSAMAMGTGVLTANALRVDYLVNPQHGLVYDAKLVAFITGILPSAIRVLSTLWWGNWFDRADFFRLRILVNVLFGVAIALYFSTSWLWAIVAGAVLFGFARGGGEILWNLWVTKLAEPEHVGEYMSVHTFLTGLRALAGPFIGFYLVAFSSVKALTVFSLFFVSVALMILWPLVRRRPVSASR